MKFLILSKDAWVPNSGNDTVYLKVDLWNDYSFVTMFHMSLHDENGQFHDIGNIRIGFKGQTRDTYTYTKLPDRFESVSEEYFSLGIGVEFYQNIASLPNNLGKRILLALSDIVAKPHIIEEIKEEDVFGTSLLRTASLSVIKGQYARVLEGKPELTDFKFKFFRPEAQHLGSIDLTFEVKVDSTPSTNIHAVIGRNGVGKTTLLNGMIEAITDREGANAKFLDTEGWSESEIPEDYFSSLVSVSFSAFDPFSPPKEQPDPAKGTCYFYIGLKDPNNRKLHRTIIDLQNDCVKALITCFHDKKKTERWLNAISKLGSDENFASMRLEQLKTYYNDLRRCTGCNEQSDSNSFWFIRFERTFRKKCGHTYTSYTVTSLN